MNGKFVTIEGCDGVGKSTQVRLLRERFEREGIRAVFTREPGGTVIAEKIRKIILEKETEEMDAMTELLLYEASRRQHTARVIEPALESGKLVICDRYVDSTLAYQGYGRGLDIETIKRLNAVARGHINIDLTLFLDVTSSEGFRRKGGRASGDRLESESGAFYERVYAGFSAIADDEKRVVRVDASGTKFETHEKLYACLDSRGYLNKR
ncbi:MAG: dTMP kinase [Clostridia bacterium]|nr:dTMP kinase [Clostridia bacterium]